MPSRAHITWRQVRNHLVARNRSRRRPLTLGCLVLEDRTAPATFTVTNTNDAGAGSLRQAILDANADSVADQIVFDPSLDGQTITLTSGQLSITEPVTITGPGPARLTIDANYSSGIFSVDDGQTSAFAAAISGLTLTHGLSATLFGGAVRNQENLTIDDCAITSNSAPSGGGIYNGTHATLTLTNSVVTENAATDGSGGGLLANGAATVVGSAITGNSVANSGSTLAGGGGIFEASGGTLSVTDSTVTSNSVQTSDVEFPGGGGISVYLGSLTLTDCLVQGNTVHDDRFEGNGGGLYNDQGTVTVTDSTFDSNSTDDGGGIESHGPMTITGSTISNNTAAYFGGGIEAYDHTLKVTDSTITGNTGKHGGGFYDPFTPSVTFTNVTICNNTATADGGGTGGYRNLPFYNSIVAGNTAAGIPSDIGSTVAATSSHNLIGDPATAGGLTDGVNGNIIGANGGTDLLPLAQILDPHLVNHGGPTLTYGLIPGSPALDAGDDSKVTTIPYDQRGAGYPRIVGSHVDIGAFEQRPWAVPTVTVDPAQPNPTHVPSPVVFDVTFDQPVTGFDAAQVDFTRSTAPGTLTATIAGSGQTYTVAVTGATGDGTVAVAIKAGTGSEGLNADNQNNLPSPGPATVMVDTTRPTVTVARDPAHPDPTHAGPILFDVQFDEPVVGFSAADVQLVGTEAGTSVQSVTAGGPPNSYVVTVTGMAAGTQGTVVATIPAGAPSLTDLAGNPNAASTGSNNSVTFDNVPPTVAVTLDSSEGDPAGGLAVLFDVTFSEPVVGFDGTKVDLAGTMAPGAAASVTDSGDHTHFTVTVSGMTAGGPVQMAVDAGKVTDLAGNPNEASNSVAVTYAHSGTVQFSAPTYAIDEQGAPTLQVTLTRTGGAEGPLAIDYAAADGTAELGTDYAAPLGTGTLTWADGDTGTRTISVPIIDDGQLDADKDFTLSLSNVSLPGALGSPNTATVTIQEEAGLGLSTAAYGPFAQTDGQGNLLSATVVVRRQFDSHGTVTVHYSTADGTAVNKAVAGRDYAATSGILTWADGDTADQTITIPLLDDGKSHGRETFSITLDTPGGNALVAPITTATVTLD